MRASGILMPVFSLPGPFGIGTLGSEATAFVDFLAEAKQTYWQILPIGPTGYGDSPYQSFSAFAGNPYFIDFRLLAADGYLTAEEIPAAQPVDTVDYGALYNQRPVLLKKAADRLLAAPSPAYEAFCTAQSFWLEDYALFMAVKAEQGQAGLADWPDALRCREPEVIAAAKARLADQISYHKAVQFFFYTQWNALKAYANGKGVRLVGDIPIYVSPDSSDLWTHPELFQTDGEMHLTQVAGCPPDAFAADGQLWGNPLYDWAYHKKTGYTWWIQRVRHALGIYDLLRIDHFRGFDTYWAIPATSTTARTGKWENGPGMELFDALEAALGKLPIIAEDLGELFPSVRKLLADSTFPGMKVLQFAFGGGDNEYLPHNHVKNGVVYPGTHDNTTLTDWWENGASEKEKATAAAYLHLTPCKPTAKEVAAVKTAAARTALLRAALGSVADRAIIPMYDWLGLGAEAHLNTPGKLGGNWAWRAKAGFDSKTLAAQIKAECAVYCRCNADVQNVKELAI